MRQSLRLSENRLTRSIQHGANRIQAPFQLPILLHVREVHREDQIVEDLFRRGLGNLQIPSTIPWSPSTKSFGDVRRDRHCCTSHLRNQVVSFVGRKSSGDPVDRQSNLVGFLPNSQLPEFSCGHDTVSFHPRSVEKGRLLDRESAPCWNFDRISSAGSGYRLPVPGYIALDRNPLGSFNIPFP